MTAKRFDLMETALPPDRTGWMALLRYEAGQVWRSGAVRIWIALLVLTLAFMLYQLSGSFVGGAPAADGASNALLGPNSQRAPGAAGPNGASSAMVLTIIATVGIQFTILIPITFFVPIVSATFADRLIRPASIHYLLSRPISRIHLAGANIAGVTLGYAAIICGFIAAGWLILAISHEVSAVLLLFAPMLSLLAGAIYALLLAAVLATKSRGVAMTITLVYTVFISGFLTLTLPGDAWWLQLIGYAQDILIWILPPASQYLDIFGNSLMAGTLTIPTQVIVATLLSLGLFSGLSLWLYRRMEF